MRNPECRDCPLGEREGLLTRCIPARLGVEQKEVGSGDEIRALLVGHHPTAADDEAGYPLSDGSGGLLTKALRVLEQDEGLDVSSVAVSSTVRCAPPDGKTPGIGPGCSWAATCPPRHSSTHRLTMAVLNKERFMLESSGHTVLPRVAHQPARIPAMSVPGSSMGSQSPPAVSRTCRR